MIRLLFWPTSNTSDYGGFNEIVYNDSYVRMWPDCENCWIVAISVWKDPPVQMSCKLQITSLSHN